MGIFDNDFEEKKAPSSRRRVHSMKRAHELPVHVPTTLEEALAVLSDEERTFVKCFIAQPHAIQAYQAAFNCDKPTAKKLSRRFLARVPVKAAIALGRAEVSQYVADSTKHDRQAAFQELGTLMEHGVQNDQLQAAVRASELRARITGALVDKAELKTSGFSLVVHETAQKGEMIDVTPLPEDKKP